MTKEEYWELFKKTGKIEYYLEYKKLTRKDPENHKKWMKSHVGKMVGAYIASVTAFIVAGLGYGDNFYAWILPTVIGTIYIIAWGRKLNKKTIV